MLFVSHKRQKGGKVLENKEIYTQKKHKICKEDERLEMKRVKKMAK